MGNAELFRTCATLGQLDSGGDEGGGVAQATHMTLRMLAERIEQLINVLNQRLTRLVERHAPQLLVRWASVRTAPSLS
ncbi:hypothetical protein ACFQE4_26585 [Streptomyces thermocoprophilus]|uniref:Transposase n=1 Tax=Streptomyces thermocoprophilus TaxID=78356 RepID=A0ABV5VC69_9ACTN